MWLVAGLGNPGRKYARTRHNAGFFALDRLAERYRLSFREKGEAEFCETSLGGSSLILIKPLTFMNRSGAAIAPLMRKKGIGPERLVVVHDDLDIAPGRIKIRVGGSAGGHNGLKSIIELAGSKEFIRVKVGIGRDPTMVQSDYVLGSFHGEERRLVEEAVDEAAEALEVIVTEGVEAAMNRFNRSPGKADPTRE